MIGSFREDRVAALRARLEKDFFSTQTEATEGRATAMRLIEELERRPDLQPLEARLIARLKYSVEDFYDPKLNRVWTFQFVMTDLRRLETVRDGLPPSP